MLVVENLHAGVGDKEILSGVDLVVRPGEVHAVMGPNGSGKSTLAHVLAGRDPYQVTMGRVLLDRRDLLGMAPEERAAAGLFLAFQHPVEIPGVQNMYFLRTALNAVRQARGEDELDTKAFLALVDERAGLVEMDRRFLRRSVNEGFSGGEKKRNEVLQMAVLEPRLAILDETDSGLDIDALRIVAGGVNSLRNAERAIVVITHHQRLLDHIVPDLVHVMAQGRIVRTGGKDLAIALEREGYAGLDDGLSLDPASDTVRRVPPPVVGADR
jgi:Fe-S cluster assembly ATP-binding protein